MSNSELEDLMSDDFLAELDNVTSQEGEVQRPEWVPNDESHNTYKAWKAILQLALDKKSQIEQYTKAIDQKTPKSLYEVTKSDVGRALGKAQQNIFYGKAKNGKELLSFLESQNDMLLCHLQKKQSLQESKQNVTGIRKNKKETIVKELQVMRGKVEFLRRKNAKDVLDLAIAKLPLDLQQKLRNK